MGGWRPSLLGWRPSLLGWRPSFLGWRPPLLSWRPWLVGWRPSLLGWRPLLLGCRPALLGWSEMARGLGRNASRLRGPAIVSMSLLRSDEHKQPRSSQSLSLRVLGLRSLKLAPLRRLHVHLPHWTCQKASSLFYSQWHLSESHTHSRQTAAVFQTVQGQGGKQP